MTSSHGAYATENTGGAPFGFRGDRSTVCAKIYSTEMKRWTILPCHLWVYFSWKKLTYKVVQIWPGELLRSAACLHTNQSQSYLNHLVHTIIMLIYHGTCNVSVRSVHRLAVDSVHIVHADAKVSVLYILAHTVLMNEIFLFMNGILLKNYK
jgi:hypothetical protein